MQTIPVSVLVLTKNEAKDLPGCLETVRWSDDVHVLDSYSDDSTVAIAQSFGAKVTQRQFDNWSAHQNWGLSNIPFAYPWVLYIDADERVTPELAQSVKRSVEAPLDAVAFSIQRRDFFGGAWLKHVQTSSFYMRLFRPERMKYERLVNAISVPDGPVRAIPGFLDHFPFSKGISHWILRHDKYSSLEAQQIVENRRSGVTFSPIQAFICRDFHQRRFHQKEMFYRLPARPLIKFLLLYVLKRGFMDGHAGLTYALLQSIYEYMIILKVQELESEQGEAKEHGGERPATKSAAGRA